MARYHNDSAARQLGAALTAQWERRGRPSFRSIARAIAEHMGAEVAPSNETIRKMHHGEVDPGTVAVEALIGLASYYGVGISALGPDAEHRLLVLKEVFAVTSREPIAA